MNRKWQMQEAKARFAEMIRRATREGPQIATYRGADTAVVLSIEEGQIRMHKQAINCEIE
jgi:prevent-host-death family protein